MIEYYYYYSMHQWRDSGNRFGFVEMRWGEGTGDDGGDNLCNILRG